MKESTRPHWLNGYFLISEADVMSPSFYRTLILIINHDQRGALGVVINRRTDFTLAQAIPHFTGTHAGDLAIYVGGPVQHQLIYAIHSGLPGSVRGEYASTPIPHVHFEPVSPALVDYLLGEWNSMAHDVRPPIHLYSGYAGWGPEQLETELRHNSWVVRPAAAKYVFHRNPQEGWREALVEMGGLYKIIGETGFSPSLN